MEKMIDRGFIKEPLDVDFVVNPRPLTEDDKKAISAFIKADKLKQVKAIQKKAKKKTSKPAKKRQMVKVD